MHEDFLNATKLVFFFPSDSSSMVQSEGEGITTKRQKAAQAPSF